ncbi:fungal-specific transcription factor domain-containing protein [Thermothelomyces heterothallicus CBS 202.75]|uniref:fungal-specific transcription factor domain-containing protein n=1 Tax=Thermothelomyces heterothallicus CBS 202.75 TaxID=1149848 RepID=UPI003743E052
MSSLSNRISLLEAMLKERGVIPPPAVHPPKTRQEAQARQQQEQRQSQTNGEQSKSSEAGKTAPPPLNQPPTPPGSGDEDVILAETPQSKTFSSGGHASHSRMIDPLLLQEPEPKKESGTRHLLCTKGSYVLDQSVGRTRFFGPTANSHVYAKQTSSLIPLERSDHLSRAEQLIVGLRPATYDYLMRCFWEYYNSWQQVVDGSAFETGRTTGDSRFYSLFLHLAMLAVGFRFADWDREDVKMIMVGNRESTLHREAKAMLGAELERPGGVPSVQALLLLADLECGVGRDATGWMYSGMANRLAFDIGLHVNTTAASMSELERQTRRQVMTSCVMFDRKWALLLGRPTAIKTQDIGADVLPRATGKPLVDSSIGTVASHAAIHRQMFELLELAGKVADFQNSTYGPAHLFPTKTVEDRAYLHFVGLERLFHNWYRRLPESLAWKPVNIKSAPMGFFMLHLQFHVCMILLHRPWAKYGPLSLDGTAAARYPSPESPTQEDGTGLPSWMAPLPHHDNRASMSRSMCTQHAIRIARIFWHQRQRFDGRRVVLTSVQYAGTAALALMAALAHKSAELDHQSNLRYLQVLSTAIYDMSHLYQPAARMYQLLKTMLVEIRSEMVKSGGFDVSSLVGRYQGSNNMAFGSNRWAGGAENTRLHTDRLETIHEDDRASKRRRLSSLSSVDFSCITPSFLTNSHQGCPSSPGSAQSHSVNSAVLDQTPSEPGNFDLDLFHASFVDFINAGGDSTNSQEWPAAEADSSAPVLVPSMSGDLFALSGSLTKAPAQIKEPPSSTTPPIPTSASDKTPAAPEDDDDTAVDRTIEEWLAEPSKALAPSPTHDTPPSTTTGNHQQAGEALPAPTEPRNSLAHATADGTPICRDPYVLSLETELGTGFDLGPDPMRATGTTPTAAGSSLSSGNNDTTEDSITVDAMDWLNTTSPPAAFNVTTPSPAPAPAASASTGLTASLNETTAVTTTTTTTTTATATTAVASTNTAPPLAPPPPPMTPVTLDELVQSVEEAVGSARARARARAAAAAAAAAASASGSGSGGAGAGSNMGNGGTCDGAVAGAGSPTASIPGSAGERNRELDFLVL